MWFTGREAIAYATDDPKPGYWQERGIANQTDLSNKLRSMKDEVLRAMTEQKLWSVIAMTPLSFDQLAEKVIWPLVQLPTIRIPDSKVPPADLHIYRTNEIGYVSRYTTEARLACENLKPILIAIEPPMADPIPFDPFEPHRILQQLMQAMQDFTLARSGDAYLDARDRITGERGNSDFLRLHDLKRPFVSACRDFGIAVDEARRKYDAVTESSRRIRVEFFPQLLSVWPLCVTDAYDQRSDLIEMARKRLDGMPSPYGEDWASTIGHLNQPILTAASSAYISAVNDLDELAMLIHNPPGVAKSVAQDVGRVEEFVEKAMRTEQLSHDTSKTGSPAGQFETGRANGPAVLSGEANKTVKSTKGKRINERMLSRLQSNPDALNWSAQTWAEALECSKSSVQETPAWKTTIRNARALQRADREARQERNKGRSDDE
jgi:hypothetical protein